MRSVLIGVDGSEDSRTALRWGTALGRELGLPVHAMRAWQYPSDTMMRFGRIELPDPPEADRLYEEELRSVLHEELGGVADDAVAKVARGPAVSALLRHAERDAMIVVGSRGLGGFRGLLLGSVTQQLCEHAPCPVTVVRGDPGATPLPHRILVGTDGSIHAAKALRFAGSLAKECDAELVVAYASGPVGVTDPVDFERDVTPSALRDTVDAWCEPLDEAGTAYSVSIVEGDARSALLEAAHERAADLLVVGSRGRGPIAKLLLGSVATSVIQHSDLPVTVVAPEH
jgi:nucleotide-binding universal stress UspA family protein